MNISYVAVVFFIYSWVPSLYSSVCLGKFYMQILKLIFRF